VIDLPNLESKKDLEELVYHFKGLIEAAEEISSQMRLLDQVVDSDLEAAGKALGSLSVEIYTHLSYHMKELRRPLLRFSHTVYGQLGPLEDEDG
jgi:hypothetical protein